MCLFYAKHLAGLVVDKVDGRAAVKTQGAEWGSLEKVPDPDKGVQEGFLEEVTSGSLIQFGGELEVWPRHWGLFRNLGMESVCLYGRGGGARDLGTTEGTIGPCWSH